MNLGNRNSQFSFAQTPAIHAPRSMFDRSFAAKDTMKFDELTPMFLDEVLPGDTINLNVNCFMRLAPQARPVMDNMYVDFFFFFVPNRLTWVHWEQFMGAEQSLGANPTPSTLVEPVIVSKAATGWLAGSIADHMGVPIQIPGISMRALPIRGYRKIYNDWFRAQNFELPITEHTDDGPDPESNMGDTPLVPYKKADYFTSALPWPQKGATVQIPVTQSLTPIDLPVTRVNNAPGVKLFATGTNTPPGNVNLQAQTGFLVDATLTAQSIDPNGSLKTQLAGSDINSLIGSMNALRTAMQMQTFLERDARNGTRYVELLRSHWGVVSPDFRLQRAELLSMSTIRIGQNVVAQTSEPTVTSPQANLSAYSTASASGQHVGFSKSFVEHGFVYGICRARADITYQRGLNKMWSRVTRFDHFWPEFQMTGEQSILNQEIFCQGSANPTQDAATFGFQERYAEYKYRPSEIKGQFRSIYATPLDSWHLAEDINTLPTLNLGYLKSNTPVSRILTFVSGTYPHLLCDYFYKYNHARIMLTRAIPAGFSRL